MYHGRYFRLDTDVANIEKGIAVFRYCPDRKTDSSIYVVFTDDEIVFHCNFRVDGTIKNAAILHIPIDDNIEQSFAGAVTEAFHETFDDVIPQTQENPHLSYYSTFSFGTNSKPVKDRKKPRSRRSKHMSHNTSDHHLVRRLILDFLFDLKETRIFEISSYYGDLTEKLRKNFFARCLIAKARYWYQRAFYESVVRESHHVSPANERKARKIKRQFYGEILFHAEKEWADCIRDPHSDQTFHNESHGWFDDSETEMRHIYLPFVPIAMNEGVNRKLKSDRDQLISRWFVTRHAGLSAWRTLFGGNRSFFGIHLFWPRIVFAVGIAWFTNTLLRGFDKLNFLKTVNNLFPFVLLVLMMIFTAALILIQRVVPLAGHIDKCKRAFKLTGFVLLVSFILGYVFLSTIIGTVVFDNNFWFFWISAAFIGLVYQIVLRGGNANEPL